MAETENIGRVLKDSYRITGVLGEGGMGVVYRGEHLSLPRQVAIKTLLPKAIASAESRERFEREAAIAARLNHSGVTQVYDYGIDAEMPFLIMELVEGPSLADVLEQEGPLPPARALAIARQLFAVLAEAHRLQLVHRDVKPDNIRLLHYAADKPPVVKVLDFGIAKQIGAEQAKLTATGAVLGTPLYIAPEQAMGEKIDGRADQYSAAATLYEMLAGRPPIVGTSLASILYNQVAREPPPLPPTVPESLRKVVMRMLRKDPAERYQDEAELDRALAACERDCARAKTAPRPTAESLTMGPPTPPTPQTAGPQAAAGRRVWLLGAGLAGLCLVVVVIVLKPRHGGQPATTQRTQTSPTTQTGTTTPASAASAATAATPTSPTAGAAGTAGPATPPPSDEAKASSEPSKKSKKRGGKRKGDNAYEVTVIR
ncbi:MAG TPA: serine/threonine-protein kinase [Pseudomonadota bacterium]|nr:serine/threonine-protein kinase [Pseudomonadota bacterium]